MGDLFFNKLAGVLIGGVLLVILIMELGHMLVPSHGAHELTPDNTAYPVDWAALEGEGASGAADAVVEGPTDYGVVLAAADVAAGERGIRACVSCHTFEEGGATGTGPNLWNIVGRQVAGEAGFNYSGGLVELGGEWTYEALDGFLENPRGYVSGTNMSYRGVRNEEARMALIAYLRTLSNSPADLPAPLAAAEEAPAEEMAENAVEGMTDAVEQAVEEATDEAPAEVPAEEPTEAPAEDEGE